MKAYFFVLRKTNIVTMNSVKESVIKIRIGNNKSYLTAILYCLTAVKNSREKICKRGRKCAVKPNCKRGENDRRRFFFAQLQLQNVVNNNVWVTCILWFHVTVLDNLGNKKCRHEN